MNKILIFDNVFYDKFDNITNHLDNLVKSLNSGVLNDFLSKFDKIYYVNNSNDSYDSYFEKYNIVDSFIKIPFATITEDGESDDTLLVINTPFISVNNVVFDLMEQNKNIKDTVFSQEGYNILNGNLISKSKVGNNSVLPSILIYFVNPSAGINKNTQREFLSFLLFHNQAKILNEFANTLNFSDFQIFDNDINRYIDYFYYDEAILNPNCGTYIVNYSETDSFKLSDFMSWLKEMLNNSDNIKVDIRTQSSLDDYFGDEVIETADGELEVVNKAVSLFGKSAERIIYSNSKQPFYDSTLYDGCIDLTDYHQRFLYIKNVPKYMKIYSKDYQLQYKISKDDLLCINKLAVKRTMGMGDALLTLPFIQHIKNINPNIKIDFYSKYDFRPYMKNPKLIDEYYKLEDNSIFKDIESVEYDIILDFDLCYENQNNGRAFKDYYSSFFEDGIITDETMIVLESTGKHNTVILVGEGSGWQGKEPDMDIIEALARTITNDNDNKYVLVEPGFNRISHYANITNPENSFDKLFELCGSSTFYVGTDSGVAHIMNLMGKPCFVIGGMVNPMLTLYNAELTTIVGKTELLCFGCCHNMKGFKTTSNGNSTFVRECLNPNQYQCMKQLSVSDVLEEFDKFLYKNDLK